MRFPWLSHRFWILCGLEAANGVHDTHHQLASCNHSSDASVIMARYAIVLSAGGAKGFVNSGFADIGEIT
jgi:hypothetical protein